MTDVQWSDLYKCDSIQSCTQLQPTRWQPSELLLYTATLSGRRVLAVVSRRQKALCLIQYRVVLVSAASYVASPTIHAAGRKLPLLMNMQPHPHASIVLQLLNM